MRQASVGSDPADLNRRPVYLQLCDVFVDLVTSGEWKPGILLPNEVELASRFSVSVGTIRKTMDELTHLGLVSRIQGRGTFVRDAFKHDGLSVFDPLRNPDGSRIKWDSPKISVEEGQASAQEAVRLGMDDRNRDVVRLFWLRYKDGRPVAYQCSVVPTKIVLDVPRLRHVSGLAELYSRAGVLVRLIEDMISPRKPSETVLHKFNFVPGTEMHLLSRRFFNEKSKVVGLCESWLTLRDEVYFAKYRLRPDL